MICSSSWEGLRMTEPPQHRPASITLVRHGQSESNLAGAESVDEVPAGLRGTPNHKVRLTRLGHEQARATGTALAGLFRGGFDHVYVSPYLRTQETADEILEGFPVPFRATLADNGVKRDILLR